MNSRWPNGWLWKSTRLRTRPCAAGEFTKFSVTPVASHPDHLLRSENCCQCKHQCCSYQEIGRSDLVLLFKMRYMLTTIIHRDCFFCFGWFTGGKTHMASPRLHLSEAQMITNSTHSNVSMRSCKGTRPLRWRGYEDISIEYYPQETLNPNSSNFFQVICNNWGNRDQLCFNRVSHTEQALGSFGRVGMKCLLKVVLCVPKEHSSW